MSESRIEIDAVVSQVNLSTRKRMDLGFVLWPLLLAACTCTICRAEQTNARSDKRLSQAEGE